MRPKFLNLLLVIVALLFSFTVAEVGVRIWTPHGVAPVRFVFDPQLGEIPTPNQKGRKITAGVFDHTYSNNSLGLRGSKEYSFEKGSKYRILFLGDSFSYGFGVNDDQTFPYLTEKHLLEKHLDAEVINAGNSGRGTDYELKFFQVLGHKFKPDLTILCFLANDFVDNERGQFFLVSPDGRITPKPLDLRAGRVKNLLLNLPGYNWLVSWSQAANLVKEAGIRFYIRTTDAKMLRAGALVIHYPESHQGYANEENKRCTEIYLNQLARSAKEAESTFLIFYLPISSEIEVYRQKGTISPDEAAITKVVENQGQTLLSLTPKIAGSKEPVEKLYFLAKGDGHWTPLGNALAAQAISEQIEIFLKK